MRGPDDGDLDEFGLGFEERVKVAQSGTLDNILRRPIVTLGDRPRARLEKLAGEFGRHASPLRSPYKDSTQIGISCARRFTTADWGGVALPTVVGSTRVFHSFKPTKIIVDESIVTTFEAGTDTAISAVALSDASDLVLLSSTSGSTTLFPSRSDHGSGIDCRTFANNSLGSGISWPTVHGATDIVVQFAVKETALYRTNPPAGFTQDDFANVEVQVRVCMMGPSLR